MRRLLPAGVIVAVAASACLASAATLGGIGSTAVAGAVTAVQRCDTDGFSIGYVTSGGNVISVTVGGLADPGCEGGQLALTVIDGMGGGIASGGPLTVPTDGDALDNAVTVPVGPQPAAESPSGVHVIVVGP